MGVVDVARALGMSHANVYRHFPSKAALRDAVIERWLYGISAPLAAITAGSMPPPERLVAWLWALIHAKQRKVLDDPGLFATYHTAAVDARAVVDAHLAEMCAQLADIVQAGVDEGSFSPRNSHQAAGAVLNATSPFHHPLLLRDPLRRGAEQDAEADATISLLLAGLRARG